MQYSIKASSERGSQALKKSACNVSGLFIEANVMVPLVVPGVKRSASVNWGIWTGCAASHVYPDA